MEVPPLEYFGEWNNVLFYDSFFWYHPRVSALMHGIFGDEKVMAFFARLYRRPAKDASTALSGTCASVGPARGSSGPVSNSVAGWCRSTMSSRHKDRW